MRGEKRPLQGQSSNGDEEGEEDLEAKRRRVLEESRDIDADDSSEVEEDSDEEEDSDDDEDAELQRELERVRREREEKKKKEVCLTCTEIQTIRGIIHANHYFLGGL